ncbi:recombinase family protein [Rhodoferax sp.]|uniref:recombinase family protein n=1 Tax=Rhodoferax sp. TaxID=50421 RepID=UPI0026277337|nr:recombinase family protein [Rhodoferax sp.]MDD2809862.1 recombinase family protein [Rhodoferax sp.]MDD4942134.1 recombinase family protein [Rhodoferax sp.]
MNAPRKLCCAVYTRKSTEEGLDQNFNSLHAQRDACDNYIASQKSEGWLMLGDRYDDGGFSGGNMDRPGLKRLLDDVRRGFVDTIVVYKIDRLSRSLADFAKLVELFDQHKVTFVSVTQSFNTTTSMGRLTLNILLSFAQFERELSGERVRDKISASRQRGIWMGGMPPLGYDVIERKLIANPAEAQLVTEMFSRFATVPSMATLVRDLRARGVTSKCWTTSKGIERKGKLIDKGYVYKIFNNAVYIGIAAYKGTHYPGEHQGIVSQEIWDRVQEHLQNGDRKQKGPHADRASKAPSLLRGLLFSEQNRAFTPGYTQKGTKFYRYYINTDAIKLGKTGCEIQRLPAGEIETVVVEKLRHVLRAPEVLAHAVREVAGLRPKIKEAECIRALQSIDPVWDELFPSEQANIVRTLVERITVRREGITIQWRDQGMNNLLRETLSAPAMEAA